MLNFLVGNSAEYGKWNIFSRHKDKPVLTKVPPILSSTQEFHFLQKDVIMGIVPFVATHLKERFFVFFTVAFLLFLAPAGGSNPAGPIA